MQKLLDWILCSIAAFAIVMTLLYPPPARAGSVLPQQMICTKYTQFAGDAFDNRDTQTLATLLGDLYPNLPKVVEARLKLIAAEAYAWQRSAEEFRGEILKQCLKEAWPIQDPAAPPFPRDEPAPKAQDVKSQRLRCDHARDVVHNMARDLGRDWTVERYYNPFERSIAEHVLACAKDPAKSHGKPLEDCVVRKCMGGEA